MCRARVWLAIVLLAAMAVTAQAAGAATSNLRGRIWVQPAFGKLTRDDAATSDVPTLVSMSGIPLIGSIGVALPVTATAEFEDPFGVMFGGEIIFRRIGLELSGAYVRKAAVARGGLKVRDGLLTEEQWQVLDAYGMSLPDLIVAEEEIANFAVSLGVNYHFLDHGNWDLWAGPTMVWSAWSEYDLSDVRVELGQSLEDLLQGEISEFELSSDASLAPEDALTFGACLGVSYKLADRWSLIGNVRYFVGDKVELPTTAADYSVISFGLGAALNFGG